MTSLAKQFKVISVSSNTNSFGLHGVILMDREGHTHEVACNSLNKPHRGAVIEGVSNGTGTRLERLYGVSYEIPCYKGQAPEDVVTEVWSKVLAPNQLT